MSIDDMEQLWQQLLPASNAELSGKRLPDMPPDAPVYAALDSSGRRHLLVEVPKGTDGLDMRATHGLNVSTEELRVRNSAVATYIDLECLQDNYQRTFTALAFDVIAAITKSTDRRSSVRNCLDRWRRFWVVDPAGLSREAALGLFGELWFLARWLHPITPSRIEGWQGPARARHDFQSPSVSVEVKTCATSPSSSPVHFISNIDQLANPETGNLYLFSLHVTDDALAANDLPTLVHLITESLATDDYLVEEFSRKLAEAGYSPAHAEYYRRPLRVIAEELYSVESDFPRLTKASFGAPLPDGIEAISYHLAVSACGKWRIAASPHETAAQSVVTSFR